MNKEELMNIYGGAKLTSSIINAAVKALSFALEVGRTIGSSIRRAIAKKKCSV